MGVSNAYYTGFDLFEHANKETDKREFNVKGHTGIQEVGNRIKVAADRLLYKHPQQSPGP